MVTAGCCSEGQIGCGKARIYNVYCPSGNPFHALFLLSVKGERASPLFQWLLPTPVCPEDRPTVSFLKTMNPLSMQFSYNRSPRTLISIEKSVFCWGRSQSLQDYLSKFQSNNQHRYYGSGTQEQRSSHLPSHEYSWLWYLSAASQKQGCRKLQIRPGFRCPSRHHRFHPST
jgi:hypothetical protein